jgi:hypothetical protein
VTNSVVVVIGLGILHARAEHPERSRVVRWPSPKLEQGQANRQRAPVALGFTEPRHDRLDHLELLIRNTTEQMQGTVLRRDHVGAGGGDLGRFVVRDGHRPVPIGARTRSQRFARLTGSHRKRLVGIGGVDS